jgi:hypothetical protein
LVLVVAGITSKEVLERWAFNIETDKHVLAAKCETRPNHQSPTHGHML